MRDASLPPLELAALERRDARRVEVFERRRRHLGREVGSARRLGDPLQARALELGHDFLTVRVEQERLAAVRRGDADLRPGFGPDADEENADPALARLGREGLGPPLEVFAVGQQHDGLVRPRPSVEQVEGVLQGGRQVRPSAQVVRGRHVVQQRVQGRAVVGQRRHVACIAGEGDDADAVPGESVEQAAHFALGALQAVRAQVFGQHAARRVEAHDEVQPPPHRRSRRVAANRPERAQADQEERGRG